jgi:CheY-like chemotaxis protein
MISPASKNLNILVVDDEASSTISVAYVLRHCGHAVDTVEDGGKALARLKENALHYHIVITDHAMLEVSGLELMMELRATGFRGKIMVLSANMTQELRDSYQAHGGADYFIAKPFDLAELRKTVEELGAKVDY